MEAKHVPTIDLIRSNLERCLSCGNCLYYCPVYAEEGNENHAARGRNRRLKSVIDLHQHWSAELEDCFSTCLLCGRCTMVCPQGVRNDLIVIAGRAAWVRAKGLPAAKAIAFRSVLNNRRMMRRAVNTAKKFQWLLPRTRTGAGMLTHMPLEQGASIRRLPFFPTGLRGRHLPSIAAHSLSRQIGEHHLPAARAKSRNLRVAYFAGCAAEFCIPSAGRALIRMLNQLGVEVILPHDQGCCGIAVYANGDIETAAEMAARNLTVFSKLNVDLVVTGCATCGSALKDGWVRLARTRSEKRRFQEMAQSVRDISELLVDLAEHQPLRYRSMLPEGARVTYHDPCHLARSQGVIEQPRAILRQVFGSNFIEMRHNGCCGCGGSFSLSHYDLSKEIAADKIDAIGRTGADVVINTCPGCMVQLIDGIERCGLKQKVVHLVEAVEPLDAQ